ncbi:hypothetical protein BHM03_00016322 [Ensete ventricosum]|nr:hypothetical protein BHM03_00016322 [Ensete ventricosum]
MSCDVLEGVAAVLCHPPKVYDGALRLLLLWGLQHLYSERSEEQERRGGAGGWKGGRVTLGRGDRTIEEVEERSYKENGEILLRLNGERREAGSGVIAGKEERDLADASKIWSSNREGRKGSRRCPSSSHAKRWRKATWVGSPTGEMGRSRQRASWSPL